MAGQHDLLLTKIKIPRSRPETVLRHRLYKLLETGLTRRLTLLSAPPGSGKTTLLTEWRATPAGAAFPLAWVSLDEGDNDPVRFWRYVIAALRTLAPGLGEESLAQLLTPQPASLEQVLTSLINSVLEELDSDFALVLDDYHFIKRQEIHEGVGYLLEHLPSHMHLIITTRTDPVELPLSRLRVRREQIEIRSQDLRFTQEEVAAFFEKALNRPLTLTETKMLENRTEGWAAGLQLAALSLHDQSDIDSFIQAFSGSQRLVLDYLTDEVFYHQPQAVQEFLLQTAMLAQLNEGLAQAVTGQVSSREMLEKLDRDNLFLTSLDSNQEWYRYHPLFAEFLVGLLKRTSAERLPELHRRAASWYETNGFEVEAVTHSLQAGDYSKVVELLFKLVLPLVHQGQSVTVMNWFEALPLNIISQNPNLNNLFATALMVGNRFDQMEAPLKQAETAFRQQGDNGDGLAFTLALRSQLALIRGETETAKALTTSVLELSSSEDGLLQTLPHVTLGSACLFEGAIEAAEDYLNRSWHPWVEPQTRNMLAEAQFMRGNLNQAARQSRELLESGTRNIWQEGFARVRLARIYYQWNQLDESRFWLEQAIGSAQEQSAYLPVAYLALARLEWAQGQHELAFQILDKALEAAKGLKHRSLQSKVEAWKNYFLAIGREENDLAAVWRWREEQELPLLSVDSLNYEKERHYLALVQAYVSSGQAAEALLQLEALTHFARLQDRITSLVEILGLKGLALEMAGQSDTALETLGESLQLAAPGGFTRLYLNQGNPMKRLLIQLKAKRPEFAAVERVLVAFNISEDVQNKTRRIKGEEMQAAFTGTGLAASSHESKFALVDPLSERELEVLRLIEEGISNKAIADRLYLSLATIKTHINHLYAKLGVENRVQALARARALKLL